MNDIQEKIKELKTRGWTLSAIADELENHRETVYRWDAGINYPPHAKAVIKEMDRLLKKKRIPNRRRVKKWKLSVRMNFWCIH